MAEQEVGNLAVRLSIDSAGFERSMSSIDRSLKALGQEMRMNQNLGRDWGNSITGLTTKQESLTRMMDAQEIKVRRLREAYDASKAATGENSAATENLAIQLNRATAEYNRTEAELAQVAAALQRQRDELRLAENSWTRLGEQMQTFGASAKKVGDSMSKVGKDLSMKLTAPIVAMGTLAAKSAIDFESAFAGVRKTVSMSEGEFKVLETGIRNMAKEIPAAATEIAGVAEAAGQLGIKKEAILGFTRTMVDLGVATNMSSEEAATALARLANITGMNQQDFDRLGSSVVALGNNFATTESEIVEMGLRLAGAGAQVGMSEADILGLSTALTSVGIQAEMGGSAFSRVMVQMQLATSTGFTKVQKLSEETGHSLRDLQMMASHSGKAFGNMAEDMGMTKKELTAIVNAGVELEGFSKIAGMTGEQFKQAFEKDAVGAIGSFIDGLANADESGDTAINMLQEMGITSVLLRDSLLRAGGASELFAAAVETSKDGWEENNALTKEAEERYKTTAAQIQIMVNHFKELGIALGPVILPAINSLIENIKPLVEKFADMSEATQKTILVIAGIAAAIGPALVVIGALVSSVGAILTAFGTASAAIAVMTTGVASAVPAVTALAGVFTVLTGPIGIAIAAVVGIGAAMVLAYNKIEWFRDGVDATWAKIKEFTTVAFEAIKKTVSTVITAVVEFGKTQLDKFKVFWDENGKAIMTIVKKYFDSVMSNIKLVMGIIKGIFEVVWPQISAVINVAWRLIQSIISTAVNLVLGSINTFLKILQGDWKGAWETIKTTVSNIWEDIKGFFKPSEMLQIGKDVIAGLIKGISSMVGAVKDSIKNVTDAITNTVKNILQIKSPIRKNKKEAKSKAASLLKVLTSKASKINISLREVSLA